MVTLRRWSFLIAIIVLVAGATFSSALRTTAASVADRSQRAFISALRTAFVPRRQPVGAPAAMMTLTVTSGGDSGMGTLRDTIGAAAAGDTIVFAPGVTTVTLTTATLSVTSALTIDGGRVA